jgi:hypothetical protein
MTERVHIVCDAGKETEAVHEISLSQFDLTLESEAAWQVAIGLNPPAAHDFPSPGLHVLANPGEEIGIDALDLPVNPGFAPCKYEIGMSIKPVTRAAASGESFIQPGLPRP